MSNEIDVKMTAEAIDEMAKALEHYANDLRQNAKSMRKHNDISYAGEAMQTIKNCFGNLRMDLLVIRPIREFQKLNRD